MPDLLTRYWFRTKSGYGIGVTAYSLPDARALIAAQSVSTSGEIVDVVENVDVNTLDEGHVIPNMGPPNVRGIWFPNLFR